MARLMVHRLSGLLLCILIAIVTLEIALRVLAPLSATVRLTLWGQTNGMQFDFIRTTDDIARFNPSMSKPGSYHAGYQLNEHGFWTEPYAREKTPGTMRIVAVGDSFTFSSGGVPRPQLWHRIAGDVISGALQRPVEVINLGLPGAGPRLTQRVLEVEGVHLQPDIVVYGLFIGNDFTDEHVRPSALMRFSYAARFLSSLSRLPDQLRTIRSHGGLFADAVPAWEPGHYAYDRERKTFPDDLFLKIERQRAELFTDAALPRYTALVDETMDVITAMKSAAESVGARFIVLVIPDEVQVNEVLRHRVSESLGGQGINVDRGEEIVARALHDRDIDFVETVYELQREAQAVRSPYGINDTHWDVRGNEIAGHVLAEHLLHDE